MPQPRKAQISLRDTPYYHCISRCVRRAYLCGDDHLTGKSYNHRRQWIENRLLYLPNIFAIEVCAYAVMSNHCHIVLKVVAQKARSWKVSEILHRWHKLFKGTLLTQKYVSRQHLTKGELQVVKHTAKIYLKRLSSISWFMRVLNEGIARKANREDDCTGRFWEGRFKCQALLDDAALATCMAYVDLNPIRAKLSDSLKSSRFTSIRRRLQTTIGSTDKSKLIQFSDVNVANSTDSLPFTFCSYLKLLEASCAHLKAQSINPLPPNSQELLLQLSLTVSNWVKLSTSFSNSFTGAAGAALKLSRFTKNKKRKRRTGISNARLLFSCINSPRANQVTS